MWAVDDRCLFHEAWLTRLLMAKEEYMFFVFGVSCRVFFCHEGDFRVVCGLIYLWAFPCGVSLGFSVRRGVGFLSAPVGLNLSIIPHRQSLCSMCRFRLRRHFLRTPLAFRVVLVGMYVETGGCGALTCKENPILLQRYTTSFEISEFAAESNRAKKHDTLMNQVTLLHHCCLVVVPLTNKKPPGLSIQYLLLSQSLHANPPLTGPIPWSQADSLKRYFEPQ